MYSVYQHWDPLRVCVVGRSYPPEFYSWIQDSGTRQRFENLALETEEDYQNLITVLTKKFGVEVMRPELPEEFDSLFIQGKFWDSGIHCITNDLARSGDLQSWL